MPSSSKNGLLVFLFTFATFFIHKCGFNSRLRGLNSFARSGLLLRVLLLVPGVPGEFDVTGELFVVGKTGDPTFSNPVGAVKVPCILIKFS